MNCQWVISGVWFLFAHDVVVALGIVSTKGRSITSSIIIVFLLWYVCVWVCVCVHVRVCIPWKKIINKIINLS